MTYIPISSIIFGNTEYKPLSPEATKPEKCENSEMYKATSLFFLDKDIHNNNASLALIPIASSLCTKGTSKENMVNLKK